MNLYTGNVAGVPADTNVPRNAIIQHVILSERYIAKPNDTKGAGIYADLKTCNLLWEYNPRYPEDFINSLMTTRESGLNMDGCVVDTATLISILEQLHTIVPPYEFANMGPVAKAIMADTLSEKVRREYIDYATLHAKQSAVHAVMSRMRPYGLLNNETITPMTGMNRFKSDVLAHGTVTGTMSLPWMIPVDRTLNLKESIHGVDDSMNIYVAIGPNNELLLGPGSSRHMSSSTAGGDRLHTGLRPSTVMQGRRLTKDVTVYDQSYTLAFVFAPVSTTDYGVVQEIKSRCCRNTACHNVLPRQWRDIILYKIGRVSVNPHEIEEMVTLEGSCVNKINSYTFSIGPGIFCHLWYLRDQEYMVQPLDALIPVMPDPYVLEASHEDTGVLESLPESQVVQQSTTSPAPSAQLEPVGNQDFGTQAHSDKNDETAEREGGENSGSEEDDLMFGPDLGNQQGVPLSQYGDFVREFTQPNSKQKPSTRPVSNKLVKGNRSLKRRSDLNPGGSTGKRFIPNYHMSFSNNHHLTTPIDPKTILETLEFQFQKPSTSPDQLAGVLLSHIVAWYGRNSHVDMGHLIIACKKSPAWQTLLCGLIEQLPGHHEAHLFFDKPDEDGQRFVTLRRTHSITQTTRFDWGIPTTCLVRHVINAAKRTPCNPMESIWYSTQVQNRSENLRLCGEEAERRSRLKDVLRYVDTDPVTDGGSRMGTDDLATVIICFHFKLPCMTSEDQRLGTETMESPEFKPLLTRFHSYR
ncbi:PREDICTED: uncharacterized protein LOC109473301 [Branchiostoma belcheri]|uniref:Uncharacterized protein LOC109473301 n=1 Tax=Branchiostoma belcheri TaxID=7741 RepID=A0A6P4YWL7_BRABE|nr:PREDICTED: uncharacterized protein LOC109473301 [Branchiostoma belcheri]